MRLYLLLFVLFITFPSTGQHPAPEVLTLGTFHFNFPNRDVVQIEKSNQIDVLSPQYQKEIALLITKLSEFKPTVIIIEKPSHAQSKIDSLYSLYQQNSYTLGRDESEQIGFRLARQMGLQKVYCVDEWGEFNEQVGNALMGNDSLEARKFSDYYSNNPDVTKKFNPDPVFKSEGIIAELIRANEPKNIKQSLGNYLIGPFKYESQEGDFFGVNFETGRWFNRNLKIFRNIQRISTSPDDRILVIYGSGHMNILNMLFDSSPEFDLLNTNDFLD